MNDSKAIILAERKLFLGKEKIFNGVCLVMFIDVLVVSYVWFCFVVNF